MPLLNHRRSVNFAILVVAITTLFGVTAAQAKQAKMVGSFSAADTNHDGRVTLQEFQAYATSQFLASSSRRAEKFKEMSPSERAERIQHRFEKLDSGNKGYLVPTDWKE